MKQILVLSIVLVASGAISSLYVSAGRRVKSPRAYPTVLFIPCPPTPSNKPVGQKQRR